MRSFVFLCNVSKMLVTVAWTSHLDECYLRIILTLGSVTQRRMKPAVTLRSYKGSLMNLTASRYQTDFRIAVVHCSVNWQTSDICGLVSELLVFEFSYLVSSE